MDFYGFYTGKIFDAYKYLGAHVIRNTASGSQGKGPGGSGHIPDVCAVGVEGVGDRGI